jgi:hypothetical protein
LTSTIVRPILVRVNVKQFSSPAGVFQWRVVVCNIAISLIDSRTGVLSANAISLIDPTKGEETAQSVC